MDFSQLVPVCVFRWLERVSYVFQLRDGLLGHACFQMGEALLSLEFLQLYGKVRFVRILWILGVRKTVPLEAWLEKTALTWLLIESVAFHCLKAILSLVPPTVVIGFNLVCDRHIMVSFASVVLRNQMGKVLQHLLLPKGLLRLLLLLFIKLSYRFYLGAKVGDDSLNWLHRRSWLLDSFDVDIHPVRTRCDKLL